MEQGHLQGHRPAGGWGGAQQRGATESLFVKNVSSVGISGVETIGGLGKGGFGGVGTAVCFSYRVSLGREKCE